VALTLPSQAAVTQFIEETSDPTSPQYQQYLTPGQFASVFGPTQSEITAVEQQLTADGLQVTGVSSNGLLVQFAGSATDVEAAFGTGLNQVQLADGTLGQATTGAVTIPSSIAPDVQAVVGLDQLVPETSALMGPRAGRQGATPAVATPAVSNGGPVACSDALAQQVNGALTDQQIANSYGLEPLYNAGDVGAGQTVDIYELEPFEMSDIATFDECYFGTDNTGNITVTNVDGGPGTGYGSGEAALDVEAVSAIAPGAKIDVFSGPNMNNNWGPIDTWNQIAIADNARQVSSSWGVCEPALEQGAPGVEQVENEIFEQMAAQGQSVFDSAGDDGSDSCAAHASSSVAPVLSVADPADQPYVISVGGTTVLDATDPPVETVWDNGNDGGASGGGISAGWAQPPWQSSLAVPQTPATEVCSNDPTGTADNYHLAGVDTTLSAGTLCREMPDVSALADPQTGMTIVYDGSWFQIGGTSLATPLWAAMLAEVNGSEACSTAADGVGFVEPLLYQVASSSPTNYADAFNDITQGNNDNLSVGAGTAGFPYYSALKGYDMASGLGTPEITNATNTGLAKQLCALATGSSKVPQPMVAGVTPRSGPNTGGTAVTITGSNFGTSSGEVFFGTVEAPFLTWTATTISLDTPAEYSAPATPAGLAESEDITVVTNGKLSSSPGSASVFHYTATPTGPVIDYIDPPTGPSAGSNTVTIVGSGLSGATAVDFGGVAATDLTPVAGQADDELQVTVPADTGATSCANSDDGACAVGVTVTVGGQTSSGPAIEPAYSGPIIYGANGAFSPACATTSPPTCELVQAPEEYDYAPTPTISSVEPTYANENGTSTDTITGSGFNLDTLEWVNVGPAGQNTSEDFSIDSISPTSLTETIPASPAGLTTEPQSSPISVQTGGGLSNVSSFEYAGVPVFGAITSPVPPIAPQADPGSLTVSGTGLSDVSSVVFQGEAPLNFLSSTTTEITSQSDTSLTVTVPQFFTWPSDVLLCSVTGCTSPSSAATPPSTADVFELAYPGQPVVDSSSPSLGPSTGGTLVTIQGALDSELVSVNFGTVPGTIVQQPELTASGPIEVLSPPGRRGTTVDITITTAGGELVGEPTSAVTSAATFTYQGAGPPNITSAGSATALAGTSFAFAVTATGDAPLSVSESGNLPRGLSFTPEGGGTALINGTPAEGTGGLYDLTFTASNRLGAATQSFVLTVDQAPAISAASFWRVTVGEPATFTATASGYPAPVLSVASGTLPAGLSPSNTANGALVISGTPQPGSAGTYLLVVSATNTTGTATQALEVIVGAARGH
jgi:Pro-kumamolisin, activation domain/IPT/TIG domain/Putative Ig domain